MGGKREGMRGEGEPGERGGERGRGREEGRGRGAQERGMSKDIFESNMNRGYLVKSKKN